MSDSKKKSKNVEKEESSDVQKELSSLRGNIAEKALQIVNEVMPSKVLLLNALHKVHL